MKRIFQWLEKAWWGLIVAHFIIVGLVYLTIWAVIEPASVPDEFGKPPDFTRYRVFYHIILALLIATYLTIILDLYLRRKLWLSLDKERRFEAANYLGIREIYPTGKNDQVLSKHLATAESIKIISVNAQLLIRRNKQHLVRAIQRNACIQVLIATPDSQFVYDVEDMESPDRRGQISPEILQIESLLREYVRDAINTVNKRIKPDVSLGYFSTQLRSSIIICDEKWAILTLNLPPKRSVETASLELESCDDGLLMDVINHFNKAWWLIEKSNWVKKITVEQNNEQHA